MIHKSIQRYLEKNKRFYIETDFIVAKVFVVVMNGFSIFIIPVDKRITVTHLKLQKEIKQCTEGECYVIKNVKQLKELGI